MARRGVADYIVLALLVVTGLAGLMNGPADLPGAATFAQGVVSLSVTLYGVAGIVAACGLWRRSRWTVPVMLVWGAGSALAAGLAPVSYGADRAPWWTAALSGLLVAAIAASAIFHVVVSLRRAE
jgi:uncharacterized membrane protein YwaF